jgi:hypothetical protein
VFYMTNIVKLGAEAKYKLHLKKWRTNWGRDVKKLHRGSFRMLIYNRKVHLVNNGEPLMVWKLQSSVMKTSGELGNAISMGIPVWPFSRHKPWVQSIHLSQCRFTYFWIRITCSVTIRHKLIHIKLWVKCSASSKFLRINLMLVVTQI